MVFIAAVLITGGDPPFNTAELYLPSSARHMPLTSLHEMRVAHTVSEGGLLCGGTFTEQTCRQWTPATGSWTWGALNLDVGRDYHVSWTPENSSGTYLMGGGASFEDMSTTTLITPDGSQEHGFFLKYHIK